MRRFRGGFGDYVTFNKFIIWSWNGKLFLREMCGVTLKRTE
jgi:hypothetical protein